MSIASENSIKANEKPVSTDFSFVYAEKGDEKKSFVKVSISVLKSILGVATKLSELENDKDFVDKMVNDLENYYLKSETYSKKEIEDKLSLIPRFSVQVVSSLPTENISDTTVYLVPAGEDEDNLYTEYINVDGLWEILGTQKVPKVEVTKESIESALGYTPADNAELGKLSATVADKATLVNGVIKFYKTGETDKELFSVDVSSIGGTGGLDLNNLTLSVEQNGEYQRLSMSDGTTTKTVDIPITAITDEQVQTAVETWLNEHPEATTTIPDGGVSFRKLADDVGEKIKNHITDPAFEDITDTSKIQFVYVNTKSVNDGVLTLGKTSSGQFRAVIKGANSFVAGHKYYLDVQVKIDEPTSTNASTVSVVTQKVEINLKTVADWQRVYSLFIPTATENEYIRVGRNDADTDAVTLHIKNPVLFDLTEAFGEGNEPSASEFKNMLDELHTTDDCIYGVFKDDYTTRYIDERIKIYAKNLLENIINSNNADWGENEKTRTGNGTSSIVGFSSMLSFDKIGTYPYTGSKGDVIYFACSAMFEDDDCVKIGIDTVGNMETGSTKYGVYIDSPVKNTWHRLSMVFEHIGTQYPSICLYYPDAETQNGKVLHYKCGILLNLTQLFGKGNEPTVDVMDLYLSTFTNGWFNGTKNIFNASVLPKALTHFHAVYDGMNYGSKDGRFIANSIIDSDADCWKEGMYKYGIIPKNVPIPHDFSGSVKTDSMFISDGQYGAWTSKASGENAYGGHVFHGWNELNTFRLSMMIGNTMVGGIPREDEAAILVYSPDSCFDNPRHELTEWQLTNRMIPNSRDYYGGNSKLLLGRLRLGSDLDGEGLLIERKRFTCFGDVFIPKSKGTPASSSAEGEVGQIKWNDNYLYICVAENTWKRCKLETW